MFLARSCATRFARGPARPAALAWVSAARRWVRPWLGPRGAAGHHKHSVPQKAGYCRGGTVDALPGAARAILSGRPPRRWFER